MIVNDKLLYKYLFIKLKFTFLFFKKYEILSIKNNSIFFINNINLFLFIKKFKSNLNKFNLNFTPNKKKLSFFLKKENLIKFNFKFITPIEISLFYVYSKNNKFLYVKYYNIFNIILILHKCYTFNYLINLISYNFYYNFKFYNFKKINNCNFLKYYLNLDDYLIKKILFFNNSFISNKYLINYFNFFNFNSLKFNDKTKQYNYYNNYYPLLFYKGSNYNFFFKKFKYNFNINHILYTNKLVISFLEKFTNRKIFLKINNNYYNNINNYYLNAILLDYKNYQPPYFKNFLIVDFIKILWYSFFLKDLKMLSNWITNLMESLIFKYHKKFLSFFNNFINKFSGLFIDVLKVKGFFFDIRGKVGVTGSSKKRHLCFKFGSVQKSSKNSKICFNQNLIRTYSGVMGVTYIINF